MINVARIVDDVCKDLGDCQRSGAAMPASISINYQTYKALALANMATFDRLTLPATFFGRTVELNEQLADGAYELR